MFYASLLFCFLGLHGPQCLVAIDKYGPHKTVTACRKRLDEMSEAILAEIPTSSVRGKLCKPKGKPLAGEPT